MKIGILTFYMADNYGALLQAFASKYYLKSLGHEVYIIDHLKRRKILIQYFIKGLPLIANIKYGIIQLLKFPFIKYRNVVFTQFIHKYLVPFTGAWESYDNDFDCFIVGSDQIWNPIYRNKYIPIFFCQFPGSNNKKCIAYSASMGINYIPQELHYELNKYLKKFSAISVREESTKKLIEHLVNIPVEVTIDPTFLLTKEQWLKLLPGKMKIKHGQYVVVFEVRHSSLTDKLAQLISQKYSYKIVTIPSNINLKDKKTYKALDPFNFINTIANAKFVITTSFHGTAFSLICKVPFYSIETHTNDNRIKDLLISCGIENRIINKIPEKISDKLDWNTIEQRLNIYIDKSKDYLRKNLQD